MTDESHAAQLKNYLATLAAQYQEFMSLLDGTKTRESQKKAIGSAVRTMHSEVLHLGQTSHHALYGNQRIDRSFEFEHDRLWHTALHLHLLDHLESMSREAQDLHEQIKLANPASDLAPVLKTQIEQITIPLLAEHEEAGDDLHLYVKLLMNHCDDAAANKIIAQQGSTPPQTADASFAMFDYLHKAKIAALEGQLAIAYSYLLDTSNLIGLHDGARYVVARIDKVGDSRRGAINVEKGQDKRREKKLKAKKEAYKFFCSLRDKKGKGIVEKDGVWEWKSGAAAATEILDLLEKTERGYPVISHRTLTDFCLEWLKPERKKPEPRLNVTMSLSNGMRVKIRAGH